MSTKERNWSREEEEELLDLINQYGEKWKFISSKMTSSVSLIQSSPPSKLESDT
jgi:hypothetical protein